MIKTCHLELSRLRHWVGDLGDRGMNPVTAIAFSYAAIQTAPIKLVLDLLILSNYNFKMARDQCYDADKFHIQMNKEFT